MDTALNVCLVYENLYMYVRKIKIRNILKMNYSWITVATNCVIILPANYDSSHIVLTRANYNIIHLSFTLLHYYYYYCIIIISPGPVAPLHWIQDCVLSLVPDSQSPNRNKILVGLNFYGYDFTSSGMEGAWIQ